MSSLPVTLTTAAGAVIDLSDLVEALADVAAAIAGGSVSVEDSAAAALLTTIDADTSKIPALGSAAMAASAPVTIATDDTMMTALDAAVDANTALLTTMDADTSALAGAVAGTEVQVDVVAALPAGTNAIGKLAANSGVDIGDVNAPVLEANEAASTYTHAVVACGATTTALLAADTDRKGALLQNISDEAVYIKLVADAVVSEGIVLPPANSDGVPGTFEMSTKLGNLATGAINGICASGSKNVLVTSWK